MEVFMLDQEIRDRILHRIETVLSKPRTSATSPQALVEIVSNLLAVCYDENKFQKYMHREFGSGSRPWYMSDDMDFTIATNRLKSLVEFLYDGNFAL